MKRIRTKTISTTVLRDTKTGKFASKAAKPSKRIVAQAVRIPTRTLFGYGQQA